MKAIFNNGFEIFGRINDEGNVDVLNVIDGEAVTRFDESMPTLWPLGSNLSSIYEHADGITLSRADAEKLGIEIE